MDDPDAPGGTFTHWVLYNIPADTTRLPAKSTAGEAGTNSAGRQGYMGPCPPSGTHRYFFKLYALDNLLKLGSSPKASGLVSAMQGHILGQAILMGTYQRK